MYHDDKGHSTLKHYMALKVLYKQQLPPPAPYQPAGGIRERWGCVLEVRRLGVGTHKWGMVCGGDGQIVVDNIGVREGWWNMLVDTAGRRLQGGGGIVAI